MDKPFHKEIASITEFTRRGYRCIRLGAENNFYLFKLTKDNKAYGYKILRGKKYHQPDGTPVYAPPSEEDFGTYGWYINGKACGPTLDKLKARHDEFPAELFKALIEAEQ